MSLTVLKPGDRVSFEYNGRRLRGEVAGDALMMGSTIPVIRPRRGKPRCRLDRDLPIAQPKTRWIEREKLRKLPERKTRE